MGVGMDCAQARRARSGSHAVLASNSCKHKQLEAAAAAAAARILDSGLQFVTSLDRPPG